MRTGRQNQDNWRHTSKEPVLLLAIHLILIWKSIRLSERSESVSCYDKHVIVPITTKIIAVYLHSMTFYILISHMIHMINQSGYVLCIIYIYKTHSNAFSFNTFFLEYVMRQCFLRLMGLIGRTSSCCSTLESLKMLEGSFPAEKQDAPYSVLSIVPCEVQMK